MIDEINKGLEQNIKNIKLQVCFLGKCSICKGECPVKEIEGMLKKREANTKLKNG